MALAEACVSVCEHALSRYMKLEVQRDIKPARPCPQLLCQMPLCCFGGLLARYFTGRMLFLSPNPQHQSIGSDTDAIF